VDLNIYKNITMTLYSASNSPILLNQCTWLFRTVLPGEHGLNVLLIKQIHQ